ncbi:MAG: hypothetical protein M0Q44_04320 [Methylobacter sp.]|jgi:hypothetical protein|nr:hypothetical protein [Methylobacter sp.]
MAQNSYFKLTNAAFLLALFVGNANAAPSQIGQTREKQSPVQNCASQSTCTNTYNQVSVFDKERIGKKLAIRSIYLIPINPISEKFCDSQTVSCKDTYEVAFIYLELQSIWPEPFLLTAARVNVKTRSSSIHTDAGLQGGFVLASQITKNSNPGEFLFKPGEVKLIALSQGIKLDGVLDFFKGDVLNDTIWGDQVPVTIPNLGRVDEFNRFLRQRFGKTTTIRIRLFEKDYQSALTTEVELGHGSDLFAQGDVAKSQYQFKFDSFIGEVLYQLQGGIDSFENRYHRYTTK